MNPKNRRRTILLAGAGLLLLQLGWILSLAPNYGIDEFEHSLRASSVAEGHWKPGTESLSDVKLGRGELIPVRADVAATVKGACQARPYTGTYNCVPKQTLADNEVLIVSGAGRYNPAFYAVVGTVAKPFHGLANLYAMRIATALIATALFMAALSLALASARTVWPLVTMMVAVLPTTVYSSAFTSPNGVEMFAGLGVWVALRSVVTTPRGPRARRRGYAFLALCAAVLANTHTLGLVWLALIIGAIAVLEGPARTLRALLPSGPGERIAALLGLAGVAFELAWVVLSGVNSPADLPTSTFSGNPWPYAVNGLVLWPLQAIGAFPMRNDPAPAIVLAAVAMVGVTVIVLALRRTTLRSRAALTLALVTMASFVVPAALTVRTFAHLGSAWQGRYGMPFTVGVIVILGVLLDQSVRPVARARMLALSIAAVLVAAHLISQLHVMTTQRGYPDLVAATSWSPPSTVLLIVVAAVAGICWVGAVRTASTTPATSVPPRPLASPALEGALG